MRRRGTDAAALGTPTSSRLRAMRARCPHGAIDRARRRQAGEAEHTPATNLETIEIEIDIGIGIGMDRVGSTAAMSGAISIAISILIWRQSCPLIAVRFEIANGAPTLGLAA